MLKEELKNYLGLSSVEEVREFIRYDVENISDEIFAKACKTVFSEPPVDDLYDLIKEVNDYERQTAGNQNSR